MEDGVVDQTQENSGPYERDANHRDRFYVDRYLPIAGTDHGPTLALRADYSKPIRYDALFSGSRLRKGNTA